MGRADTPPPMGFTSHEQLPDRFLAKVPTPHLIGPKRSLWGRMAGDWQVADRISSGTVHGCEAWLFDYTRKTTTSVGEESESEKQKCSVVVVNRGVPLSFLRVEPRGVLGRLFSKISSPGLELGDPAFDAAFTVSANDSETATKVLGPPARAMLAASALKPTWDLGGPWLVGFTKGFQDHDHLRGEAESFMRVLPADIRTGAA